MTTHKKPTTLHRQELIRNIAREVRLPQNQVAPVIDALLEQIRDALSQNTEVRLTGFGSFKVYESPERKGKHPVTRIPFTVPARKRVRFSPSQELAKSVLQAT